MDTLIIKLDLIGTLFDDLVKIEWKDEEDDEEEKLTNGVKQISINGMDENTKGIPKVTNILTLSQYTFNSSTTYF